MNSDAGRQGVNVSTNDDTNVSAHTDTLSREPGSEATTKALDVNVFEKDSNMDKLSMEQAVNSASEETPITESITRNTDSEVDNSKQKYNDLCNEDIENGTKMESNFLRPRTDSNLSRGSSEVNWEELQKTENQHVQEEGSDEVSYRHDNLLFSPLIPAFIDCGFSPRSIGARE